MTFLRSLALGLGTALAMTAAFAAPGAAAAEKAIIVLDGSGSMWAQIDGKARIEIARQTLGQVLEGLPGDLELGLMSYGHRTKGDCDDIEMLVAPAAGSAEAIIAAADAINPKGKTPISAAVRKAAEDLNFTEDKATVILITDGLETCEADPCALASELEGQGVDFTTHVLGFGLTEEEGKQVACLAENTGGRYFPASDAAGLTEALTATVATVAEAEPAPEPAPAEEKPEFNFAPEAIMAEGGDVVGEDADLSWEIRKPTTDGSEGEWLATEYGGTPRLALEPGTYAVTAKAGYAATTQTVTIAADDVAKPLFVLNAGTLTITPYGNEGEPVADDAAVIVNYPGGETTGYGKTTLVLPAGEQKVTVKLGEGAAELSVALKAGETVSRDVMLGTGHVTINAAYAEGMAVDDGGLSVKVVKAKKNIQGEREEVSYGYGPGQQFDLPPGDYVAIARMESAEAEAAFTLKSGDASEVLVTLDAGVVAVDGPAGTTYIEIFEAKKDIQGNRKSLAYFYEEDVQLTLNAGDYVAVTTGPEDKSTETAFTITAGERTEITVE